MPDQNVAHQRDALAGECRFDGVGFLAQTQTARDLDLGGARFDGARFGHVPLPCRRVQVRPFPAEMDERMSPKVGYGVYRRAGHEQCRTHHGDEAVARQFVAFQIRYRGAPVADRKVRRAGAEIGRRLGRLDLKVKIDVLLQLRKTRHEPTARKRRCRGDNERSVIGVRAQTGDGRGEAVQPVAQHREETLSGFRQCDGSGPAPEQRLSRDLFQEADLMADGGGRHGEFLRRPGEAQMAGRSFESAQRIEWWQLPHTRDVDELSSSCKQLYRFTWNELD
ncbi:MAG: hypothetical protein MI785_13465 [Kiloniellales bacterium]|nr:hypothetical protein [Kiloniellales bacterium]